MRIIPAQDFIASDKPARHPSSQERRQSKNREHLSEERGDHVSEHASACQAEILIKAHKLNLEVTPKGPKYLCKNLWIYAWIPSYSFLPSFLSPEAPGCEPLARNPWHPQELVGLRDPKGLDGLNVAQVDTGRRGSVPGSEGRTHSDALAKATSVRFRPVRRCLARQTCRSS